MLQNMFRNGAFDIVLTRGCFEAFFFKENENALGIKFQSNFGHIESNS